MTMKRQMTLLLIGAAFVLLIISVSFYIYLKIKYRSMSKVNFQNLEQYVQQVPQDKLNNAIAVLKESLSKKPRFAEAHVALGMIYNKKDLPDEALSELKTALTINPDLFNIYQEMYLIYKKKGMEDEAKSALESYERLKGNR